MISQSHSLSFLSHQQSLAMTAKKQTFRSKKDAFDILDGQVKLFRTTSKVWQMQMWISEEQKYVRESLKTDDIELAQKHAQDRFIFYRARLQKHEKIFSISASELREQFLAHVKEKVEQRQISSGRESNIKTHTKHYLEFVGKISKIQNIDAKKFKEYLSFRRKSKSDILATVVINESITIKQMYKFAIDKGFINQSYRLDFGTIKKQQDEAVRDSYTDTEYLDLVNVSKNWYKNKDAQTAEEKYYRRLLNDFIVIMGNSGFRTQEVRLLKWKDIKNIKRTGKDTYAEVVIRAENSKVRKSRTTEIRRGDVFSRIKSYSEYTENEDFVFSQFDKNDVINKTQLYSLFKKLKDAVKKKNIDFDASKSLYSLRHLWITMRILAGQNVYDIAKISGTSLQQIQKHYDAATSLLASQKMNKIKLRFDSHKNVVLEEDDA